MKTASFLREMIQALLPRASQLPDERSLIASSNDHTLSFKQAKMMNDNVVLEPG
jgi:predicted alpha/beta hydrolase family esterase